MSVFSDRLKERLKVNNLTQHKAADALYIGYDKFNKWATGKAVPDANELTTLCQLMHCEAGYLLGEQKQPYKDYIHFSKYTGLSYEAVEYIANLQKDGRTDILNILSALLTNNSGILDCMASLVAADYTDLLLPIYRGKGKTPVSVSEKRLYDAEKIAVYDSLVEFLEGLKTAEHDK